MPQPRSDSLSYHHSYRCHILALVQFDFATWCLPQVIGVQLCNLTASVPVAAPTVLKGPTSKVCLPLQLLNPACKVQVRTSRVQLSHRILANIPNARSTSLTEDETVLIAHQRQRLAVNRHQYSHGLSLLAHLWLLRRQHCLSQPRRKAVFLPTRWLGRHRESRRSLQCQALNNRRKLLRETLSI